MSGMSIADYKAMAAKSAGKPGNKFRAKKTIVGSVTFDSKAEATRYSELRIMEHRGEISDLELQPAFPLIVNGHIIGTYEADFRYRTTADDRRHVEDVKSPATMTPQYRLKKKLTEALYPGVVVEEREVKGGKSHPIKARPPKLVGQGKKPRKSKAKANGAGAIN